LIEGAVVAVVLSYPLLLRIAQREPRGGEGGVEAAHQLSAHSNGQGRHMKPHMKSELLSQHPTVTGNGHVLLCDDQRPLRVHQPLHCRLPPLLPLSAGREVLGELSEGGVGWLLVVEGVEGEVGHVQEVIRVGDGVREDGYDEGRESAG
jgi:hypothetical protein